MTVYGFVGASGTGKSHRASFVADQFGIDFIIDDGLLISKNAVVAGQSAKKEKTRLASVRRALFMDPKHLQAVKSALLGHESESILILGTSEDMIRNIAKSLEVGEITKFIRIEDVATEAEMNHAREIRQREGKHVIPVPTFELKKQFSGYFLHPLTLFQSDKAHNLVYSADKSIVRPTFSYRGEYFISDKVLFDLVRYEAGKPQGVHRVGKVAVFTHRSGIVIDVEITAVYGGNIQDICKSVQYMVNKGIDQMTAMNILAVNVTVKSLVL